MVKQKQEKPVPQFINDFLEYQRYEKTGTSENTIKAYHADIYYFLEWLKQYKGINEVTLETLNELVDQDVLRWKYSLNKSEGDKKPLSASTIGRKISTIHSLFRYFNKLHVSDSLVARALRKPPIPVDDRAKYLSREVAIKLKSKVYQDGIERDYAIIMVFLNAGLRIGELISLDLSSIEKNVLTVVKAKGNKARQIVLNQETVDAINRYLAVRPKSKDNALFLLDYFEGEPYRITRTSIENLIEKYRKLCRIKHCTAHTLRHTYGTLRKEAGVSLETLKELMGHERIETTLIYAKTTLTEKARVAELGSI